MKRNIKTEIHRINGVLDSTFQPWETIFGYDFNAV